MSIEKGKSNITDSKPNTQRIQPAKELDEAKKSAAFSVALKYAGDLIDKKLDASGLSMPDRDLLVMYPSQPVSVKDYLKGVVLGRLTDLHTRAVDGNILEADSVVRFGELRSLLCKKLSLCEDELPDSVINGLVRAGADTYLDKHWNGDVQKQITYIQKLSAVIIPNNPTSTTPQGAGRFYPLD